VETTHEPLLLDKLSLIKSKIMGIPASFILIIFFSETFECAEGGIFKFLRWIQMLHQLKWDHEIWYANGSS
jgi:hypothetical protein